MYIYLPQPVIDAMVKGRQVRKWPTVLCNHESLTVKQFNAQMAKLQRDAITIYASKILI